MRGFQSIPIEDLTDQNTAVEQEERMRQPDEPDGEA